MNKDMYTGSLIPKYTSIPPKPGEKKSRRKAFNTKELDMASVVNRCNIDSTEQYSRYRTLANRLKQDGEKLGMKPGEQPVKFGRTKWWIKQIIPHTDWAIYQSAEHRKRLVIWKSWLGKQTV